MRLSLTTVLFCWGLILAVSNVLQAQAGSTIGTPVVFDGHLQRHSFTPPSEHAFVGFQNLIPGQTYSLMVPGDLELGICVPDVVALDPGVQIVSYDQKLHQLHFVANASTMQFRLDYACSWNKANPPSHYLSLVCETCIKKKLKDVVQDMATLEVSGGLTAEDLVKEVLIGGNCFDITNVTFTGQGGQIGTFTNGLTNIGFATGMVMATGDISVVVGPNDTDNASAGYGVSTPDGDLATLTSGGIFDLANVEFDFSPTQTPITFEFVFGSEEYCEYVNSQFNDVFGFFISGPGIAGTQNIATLPGGNPVTINSVNHLTNSGFYYNNTPSTGTLCGQTGSPNATVNEVQFDGYTRKMTAVANVIPCETYHMKLKVGDVGDGIFDSGVFLKNGSFDAGGNASVDFVVNGDPDLDEVFEGCGTVELIFDRIGGNPNIPLSVPYTITGTATNVLDYSGIPGIAVIPSGQDKLILTVNVKIDLLVEGDETIIITLLNPCSCTMPQEILVIKDLPQLVVIPDTTLICGPGVGIVGVTVVSGAEPYTYQWSNGSTEQTISPYVSVSSNYRVTVSDACGNTVVVTPRIIVRPPPVAQLLSPAPQLCPGQEGVIKVKFTGIGPFTLEYILNGDIQTPIENISDNPYMLIINQPGLYQIAAVYDSLGCKGPGQGALLVIESTLSLTGVVTNVKCAEQTNGSINTTVLGGQGPHSYAWEGPTAIGNMADPINIKAGIYTVTVTDFFGCQNTQTFSVIEPPAIAPVIDNIISPNCLNANGGAVNISVTGGSPNYNYLWNNGQTVQDLVNIPVGIYTVTITDQSGCVKTTTASVTGNFTPPIADATVTGAISCTNPTVVLNGSNSSSSPGFTYNWSANPGLIVSGGTTTAPIVSQAGTYTIVVTNTGNGCTAADPVQVSADVAVPTANAGLNQTLTCVVSNLTLDGSGSSQGGNYTYQWTASAGGTIIGGATSLNPIVSTTGTYTLVVTNTTNGCTKSDDVVINSNLTAPNALIAAPGMLTCVNTSLNLNGNASTPSGGISYQWSTSNGIIVSGQTSATAVVGEPGTYTLQVTNSANGCTDTEQVTVNQDNSVPLAAAAVNGQLNCNTKQLVISGAGSSTGPNYTFQWSSTPGGNFVSGQNTLNPTVSGPANYTLLVTNTTNNCTASSSVLVTQDIQPPLVNAGTPGTLTCVTTQLTLGDSSASIAANLVYSWSGTGIVSGGNTPEPTINKPGVFTLVVTNTTNGCSSTANININQNIINPTAVVAPGGQLNCTTPALLLSGTGSSTGPNFNYNWSSSSGGGIGAGANTLSPTVTAAGTYTLLVTNSTNGCTATSTAVVTTNANLPTAIAVPSGVLTCAVQQITLIGTGSTTGPTMNYQWGTINGQISNGQNTLQATVTLPGQYTLVVTNTANNCSATFNVNVNADLVAPTVEAGPTQILDCTVPTLTLSGAGSSTGANYTYQWTGQNGAAFLTPTDILNPQINTPGVYTLLVTNTLNGCSATDNVAIQGDANDPIVAIAAPAVLNCITPQVNLNANGSSTGPNFAYSWNGASVLSGGTTLNATADAPGDYTLVITNTTNGCTSDATINVVQDIAKPPADAGADKILNCFNPQLQLGGTGNPVGPNFTFAWTGSGILSGANTAAPVINQGGGFILVVTNVSNGCTSTDNVTINTDFVAPQANAGPGFQLTCVQNTFTMSATASTGPGFAYQWTTNTGSFVGPSNILNPTVNGSGDYFLLVTNIVNGCTQSSTANITQAADVPVAIAANAPELTCTVTNLTLSGAGSSVGAEFTYNWVATLGGNIVNGVNTLNPSIDKPGLYTLSVINTTNNCISNSSVTVDQDITPPVIDAGLSPTLTCANPSAQLLGSVASNGSFTYQWQAPAGGNILSGNTSLTPTVNAGGSYTLTVTSQQNGCTSVASVLVLVDQIAPTAAILSPDVLTCTINKITINAAGSSTGNMAYTWTTVGGNILDQINPLAPSVNKPGTYTLLVKNNDNGCTQSTTTTVLQDIVDPIAKAGTDGLLTCAVTSLQLDGTGSSQTGDYFYQWSTSNGQILVGANSLMPTIVAGGTYQLFIKNNTNGCTATDNVLVDVNTQAPAIAIATPAIITCTQPLVTLNGSGSQGGADIAYSWSTIDGNIVGNDTQNKVVVDNSGTYLFTVLDITNGCSSNATVVVSDNIILPIADAGIPFTLTCSVDKVSLQGAGSTGAIYTYTWSTTNGQIVSGSNLLNPVVNQPGLYTLSVLNTATGCKKVDTVAVYRETNVPNGFDLNLKRPSCKDNDGVITFGAVNGGFGPYLYSINNGQNYVPTLDFANIAPGQYDLWIQDINGCEFHQPLNVPKALDPGITVPPSFDIVLGDSLSLQAILPVGYPINLIDTVIWSPTDGLHFNGTDILSLLNPGAKPFKPTEYLVTLISIDGCQASDRVLIRVDNEPHIFIPNVFTPGDDDTNNNLVYVFADGDQVARVDKFQIFDRWGTMIFTDQNFMPNDPSHGWDGTVGGKTLDPAVFVYFAEILLIDGRKILYKGDVTLVR